MPNVLLVDDDPEVLHALRRTLESERHDVSTAATGGEALALLDQQAPDLVILDLALPDVDGLAVTREIRQRSAAPVLILSGRGEEVWKVQALDSGADDYLEKPFGVEELRARIRAVLRRGPAHQPVVRAGDLVVDLTAQTAHLGGTEVRLTPIEWRLLRALVARPGVVVTHEQLAARVWPDGAAPDFRQTLRAHVRSLRAKLRDDATSPTLLRTESGTGYRWVAGEAEPAEPADGAQDPGRATVHDLNNALTALTLSLYRAGDLAGSDRPSSLPDGLTEVLERAQRSAQRAASLGRALATGGDDR